MNISIGQSKQKKGSQTGLEVKIASGDSNYRIDVLKTQSLQSVLYSNQNRTMIYNADQSPYRTTNNKTFGDDEDIVGTKIVRDQDNIKRVKIGIIRIV